MEAEFQAAHMDVTATTDAKVKSHVRKDLCGGSVSFRDYQLSIGEGSLSRWLGGG